MSKRSIPADSSAGHFLAFDLGAESGRAVLGTLSGGRLTLEDRHRFANPTARMLGQLHWDVLRQWEELKTGLKKAAAHDGGKDGMRIDGIGVDCWGVDFALLDAQGKLLANPVHYRDSRTDGMMPRAFALLPREEIFQTTGIQFMQINTLYQLLAARLCDDRALAAAERLMMMPDFFHYLLSGEAKNELSIASTSQMCDARTRDWARPMLQKMNLPTRLLGEIVPAGTVLGKLLPQVAAECHLGRELADAMIITPGSHDTASAVVAAPAEGGSANWCYISSGTWSLMGVEIDQPIINEQSLACNYTNEAGVGGSIRLLKNIMGLWLVQECRRHFLEEGRDYSYAELAQLAAAAEPLAAIINPDDAPFLSPGEMPAKIAAFCRRTEQPPPRSPGAMIRCCLESLALAYRRTLENLQSLVEHELSVIHIVGGGSQNTLLNQMTADACARPVIAGPIEATAIGNILVQAMALGKIPSLSAARGIVRESFSVQRYEPAQTQKWDVAYERFVRLI